MMRVAVVGAGIQGTGIALELAARGCDVDVFEASDAPFTGASAVGEGKLHCGFLYALDHADRTAALMRAGSRVFSERVTRWTGNRIPESAISAPFVYAVHRDSLLGPDDVASHLKVVAADLEADTAHAGYPRPAGRSWLRQMSSSEVSACFSDEIVTAFETGEVAVDPSVVARLLGEALLAHPRIDVHLRSRVEAVEGRNGELFVVGGERHGPYRHVVNAAWAGRLLLDSSRGAVPNRPWLFRHKVGVTIDASDVDLGVTPSTTIVLGPFGDLVDRGDGRLYLSWYPVCQTAMTDGLLAPGVVAAAEAASLIGRTIEGLARAIPMVGRLRDRPATAAGGIIFSWGADDIDHRATELHQRHDIGPHSFDGGYHTVDTGKLTMAPLFAGVLADRIAPIAR